MDTMFHCPFCEKPLQRADNSPILDFLENKIREIKEEL
jgi:transcription initiation factor IIE alpha subunit